MFEELFLNINTNFQNTDPDTIQSLLQPGLCHYLILGVIIFTLGIIIIILSKNLIKTLIGLQFMLNAVCLNFVAANAFLTNENSPVSLAGAAAGLVQNTIANSFAPIQNLNFTFQAPEGQAAAFIIAITGLINTAVFFGLICTVFFKFKNTETTSLCVLKSADCPTDKDLENEGGL